MPQLIPIASTSGASTPVPPTTSTSDLLPASQQPASKRWKSLTGFTTVPYWNVNVSTAHQTDACPEFLQDVYERDREILATGDEDYVKQDWDRVVELIRSNRLDLFERKPSDLRRYLQYIWDLKRTHGSVLKFIQQHRLHWPSTTPSGDRPFTNTTEYKILWNDWPYGLATGISHLVVWTKFLLPEDPTSPIGDLLPEVRDQIEAFVTQTFCHEARIPRTRLVWFKNWSALKSVHAIEHFHVMLDQVPREVLVHITDGDIPTSEKLKLEE